MYLTGKQSVKWKDFPDMGEFVDRMEREDAIRPCKDQPVWHYDEEIRWNLSGDRVLTIGARNPDYLVKMPDYEIPNYDLERQFEARKGPAPWIRGKKNITSVIIDTNISTIGTYAFYGCTGLESARLPDSVKLISNFAFSGCKCLTSVSILDSVTAIGRYAFYDCKSLKSVRIPDSVATIGAYAFRGCTGLTDVIIPDSVKTIGSETFKGCISLTSVKIPDSVITIFWSAFANCDNLKEISLPAGVTFYGDSFPPNAKITVRR